ncbi:endonuclease/exonuclease/phosphatase family protein [Asticcacaulis sp. YBE204]|uniref:endonuclease/exonuclease/phosphatase family protein n=1 Tax=Asticcacaulis sp. YBE204 TaxID=1282363 RepID=UPI0003C3FBEB|nr:endonuclease/exonuclease/phosphatase family protein [Asticcacaulis sp. YBE204]ESQ79993.1 hypothetical protein AEYBE204_09090 [Asticcacaulis sp. YBE204]
MRILFSNLGYATGISGSLYHHVTKAFRHVYQSPAAQKAVLAQFRQIIDREAPDIACLVELDQGSVHSGGFNQVQALMCQDYTVYDIEGKYGPDSHLTRLPFHHGKSNAFIAKQPFAFDYLYFRDGSKRLVHRIVLREGLTLFFTHFSLQRPVREKQFQQMREWIDAAGGEVMILADFNTFNGLEELAPLLEGGDLMLLNATDMTTFSFHRWRHLLDLCVCSKSLEGRLAMQVIPQPFSDHAALLVEEVA